MKTRSIATKLTAARTRLILDKPFLGALVLRLPMQAVASDWCRTTATDARTFFYNPSYIDDLSMAETQFVLAHEALHCALSHFARRQHRRKHRWDLACDHAINPLLVDDGLTAPPNALVMPNFKGLTAEEIYPLIDENDHSETLDQHAYDRDQSSRDGDTGTREQDLSETEKPGQSTDATPHRDSGTGAATVPDKGLDIPAPAPLTPDQQETLAIQWQQRMAGAAQQALQAGKLAGELARMIDHLLQPQLPWRMLLARYLSAVARDDYSYLRPSRREGSFILPSLRSHQVDVVVAVDTSGSIKDREIQAFVAEVDALKGQMRARITLLPCDAQLPPGAPWLFEPWEEFKYPSAVPGGGGTSFVPVFDWIERNGMQPDLLLYFTDAEGQFPAREPYFPVAWLVKGRSPVPWGQRVQLN